MKKVISVFLTVLIMLSVFLTIPAFGKDKVELKLTNATVYADDEFELKLFISDNSQLSGAVIDVAYDSSLIEFVSAEKGAILDKDATVSIKNFEGKSYVRFAYMAPSSSVTSDGILFSVKFKALDAAQGETTVKVSIPNAGDFVNSNLEKLAYTIKDSTVKIINTTFENVDPTTDESTSQTDVSATDTTTAITTEASTEESPNKSSDDNDNLKLAIGLFVAGGVIIIGIVVYLIVNKRKRGN